MTSHRFKLVVIAPACDGTDVGEAWSGFQWASHLSQMHDVTVLSFRQHNRLSLAEQLPDAEVVEWEDWPFVHRWSRFNSTVKPGMMRFNWNVARWLRQEALKGRRIDLVHQLTPIALRYASPAATSGLPYVIGPLAGGLPTPPEFEGEMSGEPWYLWLRQTDNLRIKYDPFLRKTYENAEVVIGVAPYVQDILSPIKLKRFSLLCETAAARFLQVNTSKNDSTTCQVLYVGRITRMKGVRDAIRAVAQLRDLDGLTFDIVGDGADRENCERESRELGLENRVRFHGKIARDEVDRFYQRADIFLFPSMREPSGNVVFEAMSFGLPLIVADRGGPGFVVDESFGIRVPVTNPDDYVLSLASAVRSLAIDPALRQRLGDNAQRRAAEVHTWSRRLEVLNRIYEVAIKHQNGGREQSGCDLA